MSTSRRIPLSANQNIVNSPIRSSTAAKQKRSFAHLQREEAYAQPPPAKKQILESGLSGIPRPQKSPSQQQRAAKSQLLLQSRRQANTYEAKPARDRSAHQQRHNVDTNNAGGKWTEGDLEEIRQWQSHHRARFPKMVFYFDNVPTDVRTKLVKQIISLGAREEKFFSIEITHVVTTRSIPPEQRAPRQRQETASVDVQDEQDQIQTINPSLLNRSTDQFVKRKPFDTTSKAQVPSRSGLAQLQDAKPKRNMDILHRAREMNKKIWSLDKLQRMLSMLLEQDLAVSAAIAYGSRSASVQTSQAQARHDEKSLLQLLHNERVNGPSDRDPTVATRELHHFKGPYLYIYDYEEKQKPIMVREYNKVQEKHHGDWPQFRTAPLGRCPFIEETEHRDVVKSKKRESAKPTVESKPVLQPPEVPPPKPVTGKRSLSEMESAHNRGSSVASMELMNPPKPVAGKKFDFRPNALASRPGVNRVLFGIEPVASGVNQNNLTSAIRSQMISSTAATPGAISKLSTEVHGLQRKVLQRNSSFDLSSRRAVGSLENSLREDSDSKRSGTLGRTSSRKLGFIDENAALDDDAGEGSSKASAAEKRVAAKAAKRDPKPGYCENCQDKFDDFEDHILSKRHRKFADNPDNWADLDDLLSQLEREPKHKSYQTWTPTLPEYPVH